MSGQIVWGPWRGVTIVKAGERFQAQREKTQWGGPVRDDLEKARADALAETEAKRAELGGLLGADVNDRLIRRG